MKSGIGFFKGAGRARRPRLLACLVALAAPMALLALACEGPTGLQGSRGPQGPTGPQGPVFPSLRVAIAAGDIHRFDPVENVQVSLSGSAHDFSRVPAQIRGRGNTTWFNMGEKRPFRIRFDAARPMFGSDYSARTWAAISATLDYTLMRQYAAYFLGRMLEGTRDHWLGPAGHFAHLYLDGEYRGVYMISNQVASGANERLRLVADNDPRRSEFLLEWCGRADTTTASGGPEEFYVIVDIPNNATRQDVPFVVDFPGGGVLRGGHGHMGFLQEFLNAVSVAIRGGDYAAVSYLIDVCSFVDFYLVQELFRNMDSHWSSLRFQIRQAGGRPVLFAGPLWDFDFSSGGGWGGSGGVNSYHPYDFWTGRWNGWFNSLMQADWFRTRAAARWDEISGNQVATMIARIEELAYTYLDCFERNFERWDVLGTNVYRPPAASRPDMGVTPSVMKLDTFTENVDFLVDWFERRVSWMSANLAQGLPPNQARFLREPEPAIIGR